MKLRTARESSYSFLRGHVILHRRKFTADIQVQPPLDMATVDQEGELLKPNNWKYIVVSIINGSSFGIIYFYLFFPIKRRSDSRRLLEHLESLGSLREDLLYASSPVMCGKKQIDNLDDEFHVFLLSCQFTITFSMYRGMLGV